MEDEIDLRLKRLAVGAQQYPVGSLSRQQALTELMDEIYRSGKLGHPQRGSWPAGIYEDLHSEALLQTFKYIRQNIDAYDSERPLMGLVNQILKHRFTDATRKYMNQRKREITFSDFTRKHMNQIEGEIPSFDDLENIAQRSQANEMDARPSELIEQDSDGLFRSVSLRNRPDITWQDIALAKLDGETLDKISKRLGISHTTIDSFYKRNLRNFRDYFRNNL